MTLIDVPEWNHKCSILSMKKIILSTLSMILLAGFAGAQTTPKEDVKKAGSEVKQAGKATGEAAKDTGKATEKESKKVVNKSAKTVKKGAQKVEDKTKNQ